jgi:hypothetical protein
MDDQYTELKLADRRGRLAAPRFRAARRRRAPHGSRSAPTQLLPEFGARSPDKIRRNLQRMTTDSFWALLLPLTLALSQVRPDATRHMRRSPEC